MSNRPVWPTGLPSPALNSVSGSIELGIESVRFEGGGRRDRRRFNNLPGQYSFTLFLDRFAAARMMAFLHEVAGVEFDLKCKLPQSPYEGFVTVPVKLTGDLSHTVFSPEVTSYTIGVWVTRMPPDLTNEDYITFDLYGDDQTAIMSDLREVAGTLIPEISTGMDTTYVNIA